MKISKGTIASIVIILIAGLAFAAGFLQEGVLSDTTEMKIEVADLEQTLDRMNARIGEVQEYDGEMIRVAWEEFRKANLYALELEITNSTLTPEELDVMMNRIGRALHIMQIYTNLTEITLMYQHWYEQGNTSDYYIATESTYGFEIYYTKEEFESYNTTSFLLVTKTVEAYLLYFPMKDEIIAYGATDLSGYMSVNVYDEYRDFLKQPIYQLQQNITDIKAIISDLESKSSIYGYGVSLITIATILASAMATQLNDKEREKEFSQIKAKIFEDKSMIVTKRNKIAMPFLFVALIIAALGLLFPIIFRLVS